MNTAFLLVVIISVSLIIALAQEPSRPEQGVDPIQPVDPGFAYPNLPDTMDVRNGARAVTLWACRR